MTRVTVANTETCRSRKVSREKQTNWSGDRQRKKENKLEVFLPGYVTRDCVRNAKKSLFSSSRWLLRPLSSFFPIFLFRRGHINMQRLFYCVLHQDFRGPQQVGKEEGKCVCHPLPFFLSTHQKHRKKRRAGKKTWRHGARARFNKSVSTSTRKEGHVLREGIALKDIFLFFFLIIITFRRRVKIEAVEKGDGNTQQHPPPGVEEETSHGEVYSRRTTRNCCYVWQPPSNLKMCVPYHKKRKKFPENFKKEKKKGNFYNFEDNTSMYQDTRGRLSLSSGQVGRKIGTKEIQLWPCKSKKRGNTLRV